VIDTVPPGPDLADARPEANPRVRPRLPLLRVGENEKALISLRKLKMTMWKISKYAQ